MEVLHISSSIVPLFANITVLSTNIKLHDSNSRAEITDSAAAILVLYTDCCLY